MRIYFAPKTEWIASLGQGTGGNCNAAFASSCGLLSEPRQSTSLNVARALERLGFKALDAAERISRIPAHWRASLGSSPSYS